MCIFYPTVFCPCCRYGFTFWLTLAVASSFSDVWIGKLLEERKGCKIFNSLRRLVLMCRSPCLALCFVLLPHCALCAASQWAEDEYQTFIENFIAKKIKGCKISNSLRRVLLMCRSPCLALHFVLVPHCALCTESQWTKNEYQTFIEKFAAEKNKRM